MNRPSILALSFHLAGCGGAPTGPGPVATASTAQPTPAPTTTQTPKPSVLLASFSDTLAVGGVGIVTPPPRSDVPGTYRIMVRWDPGPPASQLYLLAVRDASYPPLCFNDFNCSGILAKDVGTGMPKQVQVHVEAREQVYVWLRPVTGSLLWTLEIWFTAD